MTEQGFGSAAPGAQPGIPGAAQISAIAVPTFPVTSRYYGIEVARFTSQDGNVAPYVRRRFIPQPERFDLLHEYTVVEDDRVDNISARQLGDAGQYWRLCDANAAMMPTELEHPGRRIRITMPEGIPGPADV